MIDGLIECSNLSHQLINLKKNEPRHIYHIFYIYTMQFSCSICNYTSSTRENVVRHINKIFPCGEGERKVTNVLMEFKCESCNKYFKTKRCLSRHGENFVCKKETKAALFRENEKLKKQIQKLENEKIKKELEELHRENERLKLNIANNTNNTNSNNTNTNTNCHNKTIINNYYNTDLTMLSDEQYIQVIENSEGYQIVPNFVKLVHFSTDYPQNHNIYISNRTKNNKYVNIKQDGVWQIVNKKTQIGDLIAERQGNLTEWVSKSFDKYPETTDKYNDYIDSKTEEDDDIVKESVEEMLYNNKHLITE